MQRFITLGLIFLCGFLQANAQDLGISTTIRAVVIGISDYQDEKIPDLKYAHKDAIAFVDFLRSSAGGNIPEEQLRSLINEEASAGQIFRALDWLVNESKENDQVIIYFSGHGDVETKTIRQRGYLLAYDTPFNNYRVGAIGLEDLNDVLETLSRSNKSKITLITDACRSGKLAGQKINGTQATAAAMMGQFENEVKIMSCQPNEYSLEGEEWGGGRGLFSYYLINGLIGMADVDGDYRVDLKEISRYLEDHVSKEANPDSQIPVTFGDKNARLSFVDEQLLTQLEKENEQYTFGATTVAYKSLETCLSKITDPEIKAMYLDFLTAVRDKYFLPSDRQKHQQLEKSASELYDLLSKEEALQPLHSVMKGNFAAALQDESQQAIIAYLNIDPDEMDKRYEYKIEDYQSKPAYLEKAAALLGSDHYLYKKIMAKRYYFEGLIYRLKGEKEENLELYEKAFEREELALTYDDQAAFIYNEMGMIKIRMRSFQEAAVYYEKAMEMAPTWALPPTNLLINYRILRHCEKADSMGRKALELRPDRYQVYRLRALNFEVQNKIEEAKEMYLKGLAMDSLDEISHNNLGLIYFDEGKYEAARIHYEKSIAADSTYYYGNNSLGRYFGVVGKQDSAIIQYQKAISFNPKELDTYIYLAYQYMYTNQYQKAKETLEQLNNIQAGYYEYYFGLACWNALQGHTDEALLELEKAFQTGLKYERITSDPDIDSLRNKERYRTLVKKYFPEK